MVQPSRIKCALNPANSQHEPIAVCLRERLTRQHCRSSTTHYQRLEAYRPQNVSSREWPPLRFADKSRINGAGLKQVGQLQPNRTHYLMDCTTSETMNQDSARIGLSNRQTCMAVAVSRATRLPAVLTGTLHAIEQR
jgi:hypothetical protein